MNKLKTAAAKKAIESVVRDAKRASLRRRLPVDKRNRKFELSIGLVPLEDDEDEEETEEG